MDAIKGLRREGPCMGRALRFVKDAVVGVLAIVIIAIIAPVERRRMAKILIENGPIQGWGHPWAWMAMRISDEERLFSAGLPSAGEPPSVDVSTVSPSESAERTPSGDPKTDS
jgi:hypothetical protein